MDPFGLFLGFVTFNAIHVVRLEPTHLMVARVAAAGSGGNALAAVLGAACGATSWAIAAALGVQGFISMSSWLALTMVVCSGIAIVCLGALLLWAAGDVNAALSGAADTIDGASSLRVFELTAAIKFSDFKIVAAYATMFQVMIPPGQTGLAIAGLIVVFACEALWFGLLATLFSTEVLRAAYDRLRVWIDGIFGGVFVGWGLWLIVNIWS